jgi:hypothetical protein
VSEHHNHDGDEEPRAGFWATLPRGTVTRVLLLLALLVVVVVLQRKAGAIAGCMSQSFVAPQPRAAGTPRGDVSARGPIHLQVRVPEATTR